MVKITQTRNRDDLVAEELMRRLTTEALRFIVFTIAAEKTWSEIENEWFFKYPKISMFISGWLPENQK